MLEFPQFFIHERAGIRTPDNLIKSQGIYPPFSLEKSELFTFLCDENAICLFYITAPDPSNRYSFPLIATISFAAITPSSFR